MIQHVRLSLRLFGPALAGLAALVLLADPSAGQRAERNEDAPAPRRSEPPQKSEPGKGAAKAEPAPKRKGPLIPDDPAKRAKLLSTLYAYLATAESEEEAGALVEAIERVWARGRSNTVAVLLDRAQKAFVEKEPDVALRYLDTVVKIAPDYTEGFHRRAFVYHHLNEYERALGDLRRVVALDPSHFKALDGLGQVLKELERKQAALAVYRRLLAVHPFAAGVKTAIEELEREVDGQGT